MPYRAPNGETWDCGDFPGAMRAALCLADWETLESRRAASRAKGRSRGFGLGLYLHTTGALGRARNVAGEVGLELVVLDVIDDGGNEAFARRMAFYRRLGFQSFQDRPERMFITIATIRAMFGNG